MSFHIAFPIPNDQYQLAWQVMDDIREAPHDKGHRKALISLINQLADEGIDYFFLKSLKQAQLSFVKIKTAEVGLQTFKAGLQPLLKGIVNAMSDAQLLRIIDFMEGILLEVEEG
jgi:hypothetical protein